MTDYLTTKCAGSETAIRKNFIPDPDPGGKKAPDPEHCLNINDKD
jgi:hypothetical protein